MKVREQGQARKYLDLHLHSSVSDGEFTPRALAGKLKKEHISFAALTDHDTCDGAADFVDECRRLGIQAVSGAEFSAEARQTLHLLGYGFATDSAAMIEFMADMRVRRRWRNEEMVANLAAMGVELSLPELEASAAGEIVARPHFAKMMLEKGYIKTVDDAYHRYIGDHAPAYVRKYKPLPEVIINVIRSSGGLVVAAHPVLMARDPDQVLRDLEALAELGLDGVEIAHPDISRRMTDRLLDFAAKRRLLVTAGSDYHGPQTKPHVKLGKGYRAEKRLPFDPCIPFLERMGFDVTK